MSFFIFNCREDKLMREITQTFRATPLNIPDTETQPLQVVAHRGRNSTLWGPIQDLFVDDEHFAIEAKQAQLSDVSVKRTNSIGLKFGLQLLGNFLQGFNIEDLNLEPLELALGRDFEVSFAFKGVKKKHLPITTLGKAIHPMRIDLENPAVKVFIPGRGKSVYDMYLITSVFVCQEIEMEFVDQKGVELSLVTPLVEMFVDIETSLRLESGKAMGFSFKGAEALTFAFSCIEMEFDGQGQISFGQEVILRKSAGEDGENVAGGLPEEVSLISGDHQALLGWNQRAFIEQDYENG